HHARLRRGAEHTMDTKLEVALATARHRSPSLVPGRRPCPRSVPYAARSLGGRRNLPFGEYDPFRPRVRTGDVTCWRTADFRPSDFVIRRLRPGFGPGWRRQPTDRRAVPPRIATATARVGDGVAGRLLRAGRVHADLLGRAG